MAMTQGWDRLWESLENGSFLSAECWAVLDEVVCPLAHLKASRAAQWGIDGDDLCQETLSKFIAPSAQESSKNATEAPPSITPLLSREGELPKNATELRTRLNTICTQVLVGKIRRAKAGRRGGVDGAVGHLGDQYRTSSLPSPHDAAVENALKVFIIIVTGNRARYTEKELIILASDPDLGWIHPGGGNANESDDELAERLGISLGNLLVLRHRAKKKLREDIAAVYPEWGRRLENARPSV